MFQTAIETSGVRGGGDGPEGGMDGIMQTIVCTGNDLLTLMIHLLYNINIIFLVNFAYLLLDHIWNSTKSDRSARKIIVYFTDHRVHAGRDGSKAGLLTPSGNLF